MGIFEFLMLVCFGCSWPFSLAKHVRARTTKGQSLVFLLLIELGYVFGITHKLLYSRNWVTWVYATLLVIVGADICVYFRNWRLDKRARGSEDATSGRG